MRHRWEKNHTKPKVQQLQVCSKNQEHQNNDLADAKSQVLNSKSHLIEKERERKEEREYCIQDKLTKALAENRDLKLTLGQTIHEKEKTNKSLKDRLAQAKAENQDLNSKLLLIDQIRQKEKDKLTETLAENHSLKSTLGHIVDEKEEETEKNNLSYFIRVLLV